MLKRLWFLLLVTISFLAVNKIHCDIKLILPDGSSFSGYGMDEGYGNSPFISFCNDDSCGSAAYSSVGWHYDYKICKNGNCVVPSYRGAALTTVGTEIIVPLHGVNSIYVIFKAPDGILYRWQSRVEDGKTYTIDTKTSINWTAELAKRAALRQAELCKENKEKLKQCYEAQEKTSHDLGCDDKYQKTITILNLNCQ